MIFSAYTMYGIIVMCLKNTDTAVRLSHAVMETMLYVILSTLSDFTISTLFPLQAY